MPLKTRFAAALAVAAVCVAAPMADAATKTTKKRTTTTKAPATTADPVTTARPAAPATTAAPAATAPAASTGGKTADEIRKRGKIVIGVKFDVPLFGLKSPVNENVDGFDVEVGNIIARAIFGTNIKGKVELVEAISRNREPFITDGKVDIVISTYTINDARKQIVDFAGPYFFARQDILIYKVDADNIKSVDDLNGRKVCTVQGSTSLRNLQARATRANVTTLNTYSECVELLKDGRVDSVTTDDAILIAFAQKFSAFRLVGRPFSDEPYGIGLKRCDNDFRTFVNDTLEKSQASGEFKKAWDLTLGDAGLPYPNPLPKIDRYKAANC